MAVNNNNRVAQLVRDGKDLMYFIDYLNYRDNNKEFLRGDMWEFHMDHSPKIVY